MNEELKNKINEKKDTFIDAAKEKGNALLEWCIDNPLKAGIIFSILTKVGKTAVSECVLYTDGINRVFRVSPLFCGKLR